MKQYLVIDIGGTFIKYAMADENGNFGEKGKIPSPTDSLENFVNAIGEIGKKFDGNFEGCAVSMPGRIDTAAGIAHTGGAFSAFINETPCGALFSEALGGKPVTIANDGKCAASAEAWNGALADVDDGIVMVLGTGTGGGIVLNKQVRMGISGGAGELSGMGCDYNILAHPIGDPMAFFDCVYAGYASAPGLIKQYAKAKNDMSLMQTCDGVKFFEAYDAGEEEAKTALHEFGSYVAAGIYSMQAVLDVQRYAIGGGISARPEVTAMIHQCVDEIFERVPFVAFSKPEVVNCKYGNDANLLGALAFHLKKEG